MTELNADILEKLKLDKQPFREPVTQEEYFSNTSLDMLINGVIQQLQTQQSVQIIKGEYGIGKTCFCNKLLLKHPEELALTLHTAMRKHKSRHIFQSLVSAENIEPADDIQQLASQAANRIFQVLRNNRQPVLIIDDAHLLPANILTTLFKFTNAIARQGEGELKLVFIAERSIDTVLGKIDPGLFNPDKVHSALFRPLNRLDIETYIAFRLGAAGANNHSLSPEQLSLIQTKSGGLPYKINRLCSDILNGKSGKRLFAFSRRNISIAAALLTILLVPIIYWMIPQTPEATTTAPSPEIIKALTEDKTVSTDSSITVETLSSIIDPEQTPAGSPDETLSAENTQTIETLNDEASIQPESSTASTEVTLVETSNTGNESSTQTPIARDEQWLLSQPPSHFVVQLAGAWNRENLLEFGEKLGIIDSVTVISRPRNQQDWFIMLYGPFVNYDAALQAVASLPADVQANNPWIRQIASLKKNP